MSSIAFFGAVEIGLVYAFVALGVFLSFRILDFPDLTVDGTFPLGAAVTAVGIIAGWIRGRRLPSPPSAARSADG